MNLKRVIKNILSFLRHPIVFCFFFKQGTKRMYIGRNVSFKNFKYIKTNKSFSIKDDCRFLLVDKYRSDYYPSIALGSGCDIGNRVSFLSASPIEIGNQCLIASDVLITSENHGVDVEKYNNYAGQPLNHKPIKIGNGCWIGEKAVILPGVTLGDRCVVGAGAIVTKSFPSYSMIAGNPARLIKTYNFDSHQWERVEQ